MRDKFPKLKNIVLITTAVIAAIIATVTIALIDCNKPAITITLVSCAVYLAILVYANFDEDGNRRYSNRR